MKIRGIKKIKGRKAVSPVVSTVLLVVIVVILAAIIFLWVRGFIQEKREKFGKPIENACSDVDLQVSISNNELAIINRGNVPVYNITAKKQKLGSSKVESVGGVTDKLREGQSITVTFNPEYSEDYSKILIIPILLGKSGNNYVVHTCDDDFAVECTKEETEYVC